MYQLRAMQCHVHGPNNAFCVLFRPIVSFFFAFYSKFTITTTILPPQVDTTQHNSNLHQPPPTPFALHHVHGLNDVQNATQWWPTPTTHSLCSASCPWYVLFFYFFIFILLLLTNALPRQVDETRPNDHPHWWPTTPSCLCHVHGLNNMQNVSFRPMVCFSYFTSTN